MVRKKAIHDLDASVQIIWANIQAYRQGIKQAYRVIAVELRKLLCDGKNSLLPRLFENVALHPMPGYVNEKEKADWQRRFGEPMPIPCFQLPFEVLTQFGKKPEIIELYDEKKEPLELQVWLDQPIWIPSITVRELIRSVADKEAAHSDKYYNETLEFTRKGSFGGSPHHVDFIVHTGEYIIKMINLWTS